MTHAPADQEDPVFEELLAAHIAEAIEPVVGVLPPEIIVDLRVMLDLGLRYHPGPRRLLDELCRLKRAERAAAATSVEAHPRAPAPEEAPERSAPRRRREPSPPLTPAQQALFDGEPGLVEEAAREAVRRMKGGRFRHLAWEELLSEAAIAALEATAAYRPTPGASYRRSVVTVTVRRVLDAARREGHRHAKARALFRAGAMTYFHDAEDDADDARTLHGFTHPVVGLALLEVATLRPTVGGEDELAEQEAAARAGEALRAVLPPPGSSERRMLEMHFVERRPLTEVAAALGFDRRQYQTFVRRFHAVLGSLRKGLEHRGVRQTPPWRDDVSGRALAGAEAAA